MVIISSLQDEIMQWAEQKGWNDDRVPAVDLMLMVTELAEAMEELRLHTVDHVRYIVTDPDTGRQYETDRVKRYKAKSFEPYEPVYAKPEGFGVELADVIIRILHTCGRFNIPIERLLREKMIYNWNRPYRHGDKLA